jgi:hypothetical protein
MYRTYKKRINASPYPTVILNPIKGDSLREAIIDFLKHDCEQRGGLEILQKVIPKERGFEFRLFHGFRGFFIADDVMSSASISSNSPSSFRLYNFRSNKAPNAEMESFGKYHDRDIFLSHTCENGGSRILIAEEMLKSALENALDLRIEDFLGIFKQNNINQLSSILNGFQSAFRFGAIGFLDLLHRTDFEALERSSQEDQLQIVKEAIEPRFYDLLSNYL